VTPKSGFRPERLRQLREQRGLSQREFARRCGFSEALIRKYEIGASDPASYFIKIISQQLEVSTDYLLGITNDPRIHIGDVELTDEERSVLETFRREGWAGVIRLGADKLSK
jgi:transcriptional regulator with XRE-family HTH domain